MASQPNNDLYLQCTISKNSELIMYNSKSSWLKKASLTTASSLCPLNRFWQYPMAIPNPFGKNSTTGLLTKNFFSHRGPSTMGASTGSLHLGPMLVLACLLAMLAIAFCSQFLLVTFDNATFDNASDYMSLNKLAC